MEMDSLMQSVQDFFSILEQRSIGYVLVGGIALLHYVEGRNTVDLDLLMDVSSLNKLPELSISSRDRDFVRAKYGELQISGKYMTAFQPHSNFLTGTFHWQQWKGCCC